MPIKLVRKSGAKSSADDPLLALAATMEPKMRKAYLAAVDAMKGSVSISELTKAIETGNVHHAMAILAVDQKFTAALRGGGLEANIASLREAIQSTFAAGAKLALSELPKSASVATAFDLMNPQAVAFLQRYDFNLIQQITSDARAGVSEALLNAFTEGKAPSVVAREIRGMIGLTQSQAKAVSNYRAALEDGGTSGLRDALGRSLRDGRYDRSVAAAIRNETRMPQARIDTMVDRYETQYVNYRANTIARTETIRAANAGQRELWRQARDQGFLSEETEREWVTADDDRTCEICADLDGERRGFDEEFDDGIMEPPDPHPNCLIGETRVLAKSVLSRVVRKFEGEIIVLRTRRGDCLSCTPNHPILTERGWIPARMLDVASNIVCSLRREWVVGGGVDDKNIPTSIKEMMRSYGETRGVSSSPVPVSAEDFHGDGKDGEIAVVYSDRFLRSRFDSFFAKRFAEKLFAGRQFSEFFNGSRALFERLFRDGSSASGFVGGRGQLCPACGSDLFHSKKHCFASSARRNTFVFQSQLNRVPRDVESSGKSFHRPSGSVFLDDIVDRKFYSFHGDVFNLETLSGEYEAEGIITHNCRCTLRLIFPKKSGGESEEED